MRFSLILALLTTVALSTSASAFDLKRTFQVRFEAYPFYEIHDPTENNPLKANPGIKFQFETDLDQDHYRVSFTKATRVGVLAISPVPPSANVQAGKMYKIAKSNFDADYYKLVSGASFGLLTLPFKLRTDDGTMGADTTIGPFAGWNQRWLFGLHSVIVGAFGVSMIATQDVNSTSPDNKAGITGAVGLTIPIEKDFQVGLFTGVDHIGGATGKNWGHDDKLWISFGVGYAFLQ